MIARAFARLLDQGPCKGSGAGRPQDHSEEVPGHAPGGRTFTATRDRKGIRGGSTREAVHGIGVPTRCQGEAIQWPSEIEYPGGIVATKGKRGSLVGAIPEALSGEAPKGQPMISGKNLEAVSVEAPQGQPRNH